MQPFSIYKLLILNKILTSSFSKALIKFSYNKLYVTIDFPDDWTGQRFTDKWDETWAGGLPMPCNEKTSKSWATNPQYLIQIKDDEELEFFFSLGQQDGRIKRGSVFPYTEIIHPVNLIIYPSPNGKPITSFDQKISKAGMDFCSSWA